MNAISANPIESALATLAETTPAAVGAVESNARSESPIVNAAAATEIPQMVEVGSPTTEDTQSSRIAIIDDGTFMSGKLVEALKGIDAVSVTSEVAAATEAGAAMPSVVIPNAEPDVVFNLVVTTTRTQAQKVIQHFAMSNVAYLDDLHLPGGGPRRGEKLISFLEKHDVATKDPVTLVVLVDHPWIQSLLSGTGLAPMIWHSVESQVLGHRTNKYRNLIVVADEFDTGCREAEDAGKLLFIVMGHPLPLNWRSAKSAKSEQDKPKIKHIQKPQQSNKQEPMVNQPKETQAAQQKSTQQPAKPKNQPQAQQQQQKSTKPQQPKQPLNRGPQHKARTPSSSRLYDDLYLLAKGHYGPYAGSMFPEIAHSVVSYHIGTGRVTYEALVNHLFRALTEKATRGYWGGFNFLRDVVAAGAKGQTELVQALAGWIANIPARDQKGQEIPQPIVDHKLYMELNPPQPAVEGSAETTA